MIAPRRADQRHSSELADRAERRSGKPGKGLTDRQGLGDTAEDLHSGAEDTLSDDPVLGFLESSIAQPPDFYLNGYDFLLHRIEGAHGFGELVIGLLERDSSRFELSLECLRRVLRHRAGIIERLVIAQHLVGEVIRP